MNPTFSHSHISSFPHFRILPFSHFLILSFSLLLISAFSSCSIEKRRYMDGYHVERKHRLTQEKDTQTATLEKREATSDRICHEAQQPEAVSDTKTLEEEVVETLKFDSATTNTINNELFVKPTKTTVPSSKLKTSILKKLAQDPTDPEIVRKYERNKILITIGLGVGFSLIGLGIILAFVALFDTLLNSGTSSQGLRVAVAVSLIAGFGLTLMGLITAIAQSVLKGKYPGLGYKKEKSKNDENDYVKEPKYNVGEPQPISDEVRKRHNKLHWSSTLLGTLFFIVAFLSYAYIVDGTFWGLVQPGIGQILFSLGLIGLCFFILWSWVKIRKKKKAYLEEHPELLVIPSK